ncbi:Serine/threonine-protein kinase srk1 [Colletotrichum truncatum]|uniref:Serine/threonine-protein kinase srk1 n=1 Tax=Colletotrichum truncatum TaxID=5467 RepID=A0ACC3YU80_COLTU
MSTIQQLKNFIRHGKQARVANNDEPVAKSQNSPPPKARMGVSEPAHAGAPPAHAVPDAYSVAADGQNRAAQAGHAAAHAVEPAQNKTSKSNKNIDSAHLAKLIAEENESKSKFPRYPGLERWELVEKMGDGAFSNVYRAKDTQGEHGECAIKVVRKYEMNSMQ